METRSGVAVCLGFLFWLAIGYLFYQRDFMGVVALTLLCVGGLLFWRFLENMRERRRRRPVPPKPSDLPDFDFKDIKPSDFE